MAEIVFNYKEKLIPKYHDVMDDILDHKHTHYTFYGGRGSTKSSCISEAIPLLLAMNPKIHACVFRKVGNTLKSSVYGQIQWGIEQAGLWEYFRFKVNPIEIIFRPTGQKIMFFGLDDPGKIKSIKLPFGYIGITWFEESDQYSGEAELRRVLQSTMRGGDKFWDFRSFNPPISAANWANKSVLEQRDDTLCIKSSYLDVPREWLGEAFYDEAEWLRDNNPKAYQHEYLGDAIGDGGNVFDNVKLIEMSDELLDTFDFVYQGIDWGFSVDPAVFVRCYYDSRKRDLYIFDEFSGHKLSNEEFFNKLVNEKKLDLGKLITADSSEPKSIADFRTYGANIRGATKWNGSVDYTYHWLQTISHIYIDPVRCPGAAQEFLEYEYERTRDGEIISAYPDHGNHFIDGTLYSLNSIIRRRGT